MLKKILFIVTLLAIYPVVMAQNISVLDKTTLKPLERVEVYNPSKTSTAISSQQGKLEIKNLKTTDSLYFRHLSYKTVVYSLSDLRRMDYKVYMTENVVELETTVLSASKLEEKQSDVAQKIQVLRAREIQLLNPQSSAQLLAESGNVFLQESQLGGGSPVLRGFEANKVLLVVDGIRLNNAIYRSGHLQNVITIDPMSLDKVEIVYGPGSVIYGSDALGGVMHFITHTPTFSESGQRLVKVDAYTKWASAANEKQGNIRIQLAGSTWASSTSFSYKDMGNLRSGGNRDPLTGDWGKCFLYTRRIDGMDSAFVNPDPLVQKFTTYQQYDLNHKSVLKTGENSKLIANLQVSNSSDIPRYDRLQEFDAKTGKPKYAEWHYGPQLRVLAAISSVFEKGSWFDHLSITGAWQKIGEDRNSRKFGNILRRTQEERVDVISLNTDISKQYGEDHELRYGIELVDNFVDSRAYNTNVDNGIITNDAISRYPDGGNTMMTAAAYVTHNWELKKHLIFSQGIRYSYVTVHAEYTPEMMALTAFPFDKTISMEHGAVTGNVGLSYMPGDGWRFALYGASGFRSPNIDDIGKVNDSKPGDLIIIPNPDLKPEYAYNTDLTISKTFSDNIQVELTGFYTLLQDAMVVMPYQLNGQDSIVYDGKLTAIQTNINAGKARVYGLQGNFSAQITDNFSIRSGITFTSGRLTDKDIPLDHIPPVFGITSFKFSLKRFEGVFYVRYNGWKHLEDYSSSGEDNLASATSVGTPEWYTLNLKTSVQITYNISLQAGMENILDRHYRSFASGISAPGRNVYIALRASL
ncbi:MAG: TonB-dependent receptor [Bacteroidales bacterium]|nr:TonB-dependent receptor [Bacteroidales bacterium]